MSKEIKDALQECMIAELQVVAIDYFIMNKQDQPLVDCIRDVVKKYM
jgi:hypothetical protein